MSRLASVLLLSAIGASAHPQHHGHHHHNKRADGDLIVATIDGQVVSWTQSGDYYTPSPAPDANPVNAVVAVAATPTTLATSTVAASSAVATPTGTTSSGSGSGSSVNSTGTVVTEYTEFCSGSSSKRATKEQIAKVGNIGSASDYGCNWLVPATADVAAQYDNTLTFSGATEDMTCYYWNKISRTGGINSWYTNMDSYFTFDLPAGETRYLAAADDTLGAITCQPASIAPVTDSSTQLLYTWVEVTFVDSDTGYSCVDASSIIPQNAGGKVNGVEISSVDGSTTSSIGPNLSSVHNAFTADMAALDGYGVQGPGSLKVLVNMGFTG